MITLTTERIRALAKQPFHRPGGENFDCKYAISVMDARDMVRLEEAANTNPCKSVVIRGSTGSMGFVPNEITP